MTVSLRKDYAAIDKAGEVNERAAAAIIGVTSATLSAWRRNGFARQGFAPRWRKPHPRLIAYVKSEVEALKRIISGDVGPDHPALA